MLSNHERRELARIEQGLREDPSWREPRDRPVGSTWWRRWGLRLLIGFAGLVLTIGVLTTAGGLLLQGVLMMGRTDRPGWTGDRGSGYDLRVVGVRRGGP